MDEKAGQFFWDTRPQPKLASAVIKSYGEGTQRERDRKADSRCDFIYSF